jgi:hypothetical protein
MESTPDYDVIKSTIYVERILENEVYGPPICWYELHSVGIVQASIQCNKTAARMMAARKCRKRGLKHGLFC